MDELFLRSVEVDWKRVKEPDRYPFSLPAVKGLPKLQFKSPVTIFVGENGSGKSTLLEAIAVAWGFNPEGGTQNFNFRTADTHSDLSECLRLGRAPFRNRDGYFLRAESFFNVATEIDRLHISADYGGGSLHERSHGESFLALFLERFGRNSFFVMDEPEAALSPIRQLSLLMRMTDLVTENCQFIMATHSPILMSYPGATVYNIDEDGINEIDYRDTEHFRITKGFLDRPERYLGQLFTRD